MDAGAVLSACGTWRYRLWRNWDVRRPIALFVMLNPSVADASIDDPTIRKCRGFAERWACGGIDVVNLFAFRATDPNALVASVRARGTEWTQGPGNAPWIYARVDVAAHHGAPVVLAWGRNAARREVAPHAEHMRRFIVSVANKAAREAARPAPVIECLGRAVNNGAPLHPLMLAYATARVPA